jgi:uncharacterized phiE125 gp8 family phage protein
MIIPKQLPSDGNISWTVYTAPAVEPISLSELKIFARIDGSDEDNLLTQFIVAARQAAEEYLRRALITQTIRATVDFWPESGSLELPRPPLQSITQIATRDEDGTLTVYDSSYYYAVTEAIPGYVQIKKSYTYPLNYDRDKAGIIIDYVCGYGTRAQDVPENIRQALYLWATTMYENRVISNDPPPEARAYLDLFRVERV